MILDIKMLKCDVCFTEVIGVIDNESHGHFFIKPLAACYELGPLRANGPLQQWRKKGWQAHRDNDLHGYDTLLCPRCSEVTP